jgi:hypothetical protein
MPLDDRAKEQDQKPTNVRQFIPRGSSSLPKAEQRPGPLENPDPLEKQPGMLDNDDDDPGPSAA